MSRADFRILLLDTKSRNPNHYICLAIEDALRRHPSVESVTLAHYGNAVTVAHEQKCNLFVALDGEELNTDVAARLRALCGRSALWCTEDPYELAVNLASARYFDLVFTNDSASVSAYGERGRFLPFAADAQNSRFPVRDESDPGLRYDGLFIGSAWPNRVRLLRSLLRDLPDLRWKIGLSTNEHLPAIDLPLPPSSYNFRVSPREFSRLANASRVVLGMYRSFTTSTGGKARAASLPPRVFEVGLSGTVQLCDASLAELPRFYEPDKEIVLYDGYDDLLGRLKALLAAPERRSALACAAQQRTEQDHLYDHRVDALVREVAALQPQAAPRVARASRPRLLVVAHNLVGGGQHGGVEVYMDAVYAQLSRRYDVHTLAYDQKSPNSYVITTRSRSVEERTTFDGRYQLLSITNSVKERWFAGVLARLRPDVVHYQHLLGHPLSLPHISKALGIPSVLTLHDYWMMCDSFNLLDERGRYCEIDRRSARVCDSCTMMRLGNAEIAAQGARRAFIRGVLANVDVVLSNTAGTLARFGRFYKSVLDGRAAVLPVPLLDRSYTEDAMARPLLADALEGRPLRVAVLGNFTAAKGSESALAAMRILPPDKITFRILGRVDERDGARLQSLQNVQVVGTYAPQDLPRHLRDVDLTLHLSVWPETYCMALTEAWANGCVPIVTSTGALAERVQQGVNGFVVAPDSPHDLIRILNQIIECPAIVDEARKGIDARLWLSESGHADRLGDIYASLIARSPLAGRDWPASERRELELFDCGLAVSAWLRDNVSRGFDDAKVLLSRESPDPQGVLASAKAASALTSALARVERPLKPAPAIHVHVDEIRLGGASAAQAAVGEEVWIRGWAYDEATGEPLDRLRIALIDVDGADAYAFDATPQRRDDVARFFDKAELDRSGFEGNAPLLIPPGRYRLTVIDSQNRISPDAGEVVTVLSEVETESFADDIVSSDERFTGALDSPTRRVERSGARPVEVAYSSGDLVLDGWSYDPRRNGDAMVVALESLADGARYFVEVSRYARPDVARKVGQDDAMMSGFKARLAHGSIPDGRYTLRPGYRNERRVHLFPAIATVVFQ